MENDAINLSQGYPDYDCPKELKELLSWYVERGYNQYAPLAGVPELRVQCAKKIFRHYGLEIDCDNEITITPGATEAIYCAITAVVKSGDEVIMFDPVYDCYDPAVRLSGGRPVHICLEAPGYKIDWDVVRSTVSERTRAIIINSPHNPTGAILNSSDLETLSKIANQNDIIVISDEVYEHLVFDSEKHESVLSHPELAKRSFAIFSFGKTYGVTGWKTGYVVGSTLLTRELRRVHQFVTFVACTPLQYALAEFMKKYEGYTDSLKPFYQSKRDLFLKELGGSLLKFIPSEGTFFQLVDYSEISTGPDVDFVEFLTKKIGVAAIPTSVFYETPPEQQVIRLCFCKEDDTLKRAANRLANIK